MSVQEHSYANNSINLFYPKNSIYSSTKKKKLFKMVIIYITSFSFHELHKVTIGLERDFLKYCENIWVYTSYNSEFTRQIQFSDLTPGLRISIGEWCIKCRRETLSTWPQSSHETIPHAILRNLLTRNRNRENFLKQFKASSPSHPTARSAHMLPSMPKRQQFEEIYHSEFLAWNC